MAPRTRVSASSKAPNGFTEQKKSEEAAQRSDSDSGSDNGDILESIEVCRVSPVLSLYFDAYHIPAELLISPVKEI